MFKTPEEIGAVIRASRKALGMSQMELAEKIGVSYQQIQKYEKGINELSLARASQILKALGLPPESFFADKNNFLSGLDFAMLVLFRTLGTKKQIALVDFLRLMR